MHWVPTNAEQNCAHRSICILIIELKGVMTLFQDGDYIVEKEYDGKGLCPFDPDHNSTGVYSGEYIHT